MSKHRGGGQPEFNRLSTNIKNLAKHWYKKYTARRNRRKLHQSRDMNEHQDRRLNPWDLD